jgi:CRISPR/Cas system-associated protein endoribonuclease Cas2
MTLNHFIRIICSFFLVLGKNWGRNFIEDLFRDFFLSLSYITAQVSVGYFWLARVQFLHRGAMTHYVAHI